MYIIISQDNKIIFIVLNIEISFSILIFLCLLEIYQNFLK